MNIEHHGDITHPCRSLTRTGNHSLMLFPTLTHALVFTWKLFTPFSDLPPNPYNHRTFYKPFLSIMSYAFSKSIKTQNTFLPFVKNFSHTSHSKHLIHTALPSKVTLFLTYNTVCTLSDPLSVPYHIPYLLHSILSYL